jgi:hypothetical protein
LATAPSWFDEETPLGDEGWATARRLARRSAASWTVWVALALVGSALWALSRSRAPAHYTAAVLMRVSEGKVAVGTPTQLAAGSLRAYINDLAFASGHLIDLMRRHVADFPEVVQDPASAVESLRERIKVQIAENDFIEERGPDDPPRSARLTIAYQSGDPRLAFAMATELGDLVIGSALGRQRDHLRREQAGAATAVQRADAELTVILQDASTGGLEKRVEAGRMRLRAAQEQARSVELALRALGERQALRFEVIDPGRVPERLDPKLAFVTAFVTALAILLLAGFLLAGAFDPRVLDGEDLDGMRIAVLGEVPRLPRAGAIGARAGTGGDA